MGYQHYINKLVSMTCDRPCFISQEGLGGKQFIRFCILTSMEWDIRYGTNSIVDAPKMPSSHLSYKENHLKSCTNSSIFIINNKLR